jgi:hypothetical protein
MVKQNHKRQLGLILADNAVKQICLIVFVFLFSAAAKGVNVAICVGTDTAYAGLSASDKAIHDFYAQQYGAVTTTVKDVATWPVAAYDLVVITSSPSSGNVARLRDSAATPVLLLAQRFGVTNFRMATTCLDLAINAQARMARANSTNWISATMWDTLYLQSATDNNRSYENYVGLASGVDPLFRFVNSAATGYHADTSGVVVADQGATLTTGTCPNRRAFIGFPYSGGEALSWSDAWTVVGRVSAWLMRDTTISNTWLRTLNVGNRDVMWWLWTELGGYQQCATQAAACDSSDFNDEIRWGFDETPVLTFGKLKSTVMKRIVPSGVQADSATITLPVYTIALNGTPGSDTAFNERMTLRNIINTNKWRGMRPGEGGRPRDSVWVNRYNVINGPSPVAWGAKNMMAGVDYSATAWDTMHISIANQHATPTGQYSLHLKIPGSAFNAWLADTTTNNGWVIFPDTIYTTSGHWDAEICTHKDVNDLTAATAIKTKIYLSENAPPINNPPSMDGIKPMVGIRRK